MQRHIPLHWLVALILSVAASVPAQTSVTLRAYTSGAFRWRDVAGNLYSDTYRTTYSYTQARVTVSFRTHTTVLIGTLAAVGLKPNFAYQFKLSGLPERDPAGNEYLGFSGRWWEQAWDGAAWDAGWNLNDKGDGSSPNPNDVTYLTRRDTPDATSPTGLHYQYTGYRPFAYFITDANGDATVDYAVLSAYHVLWRTDQRARDPQDGPVHAHTLDPDPAQTPAYSTDYQASSVGVFGEWERQPVGGLLLPSGVYDVDFLLTEESFHGVDGDYSGFWAHAAFAPARFTILPPNALWPTALDLGSGWKFSDWLGYVFDSLFPWTWHGEHGWLYCVGNTPDDIWLYTLDMGWLWTSNIVYPGLFRLSDKTWIFYVKGTANPRWFYNFGTGQWEPH